VLPDALRLGKKLQSRSQSVLRLLQLEPGGRWLPEGKLDIVGRKDEQVVVRGALVELRELEVFCEGRPGVRSAVVVARGGRLAAHVVPSKNERVDLVALRDALGRATPGLPAIDVFAHERLPLTIDGRVDRAALPGAREDRGKTAEAATFTADPVVDAAPKPRIASEAERRRVLVEFNETSHVLDERRWVHEMIEAQVDRAPDAIAVEIGETQLTYRDLDECAIALARELAERGAGRGSVVPVCMDRSLEMVVSLLAVL
jgi:non-ribosomal peptide synthetase component F